MARRAAAASISVSICVTRDKMARDKLLPSDPAQRSSDPTASTIVTGATLSLSYRW